MSKILYLKSKTIALLLMLVYVISCTHNKKEDVSETAMGTLEFHVHTVTGNVEVGSYNTIYTMSTGRKISVSMAQLYISDIQLVKLDGSIYEIPNSKVLKVQELEELKIGQVPAGNYKSIRFSVGLNSAVNHHTPSNSNLTLYRPDMWFGGTVQPDGFVFVNFKGTIDTSIAANNLPAQMQNFSYKIGTDANLKKVSMSDKNFSILPNQSGMVHFYIDYSKLFTGIQLNNGSNLSIVTAVDNTSALAKLIKNNISSMFKYE